jgi:uracil-DNA glycosylase
MQYTIGDSWKVAMQAELEKEYFIKILAYLAAEKKAGKSIYPKENEIFSAFDYCAFDDVRIVLLGQDPYHGANQAHGLCFSVNKEIKIPPSLVNIFKELVADLHIEKPSHGNLHSWAKQGILMLNSSLTVEDGLPMSHSKIGWETFTDAVIKKVSDVHSGIVFILWGGFARKKKYLIDTAKHHILESAHPSPLSAHNGFWDTKPFSAVNNILQAQNKKPIDWSIA